MRVAISMRSVHKSLVQGNMDVTKFLKYASSLAVDGVELDDLDLRGTDQDYAAIRDVLIETGLKVSCYDIHHRMEAVQGRDRQEVLDEIKEELAVAELLGAEYVQIFGEMFDPGINASDIKALILQLVEMALPALQGKDLGLAIENPKSAEFQSQHMAALLEQIDNPRVKVGFNMANSLLAGEDPEVALENLKDRIAHVRAVDVRLAHQGEEPQIGGYVGCVIGLGLVPLKRLFQVLQAQDYRGWISLEFTGLEEAHFGIEASLKNLRQSLHELQHEELHPEDSTESL